MVTKDDGVILIIEDSEDDYKLMIEGFKKASIRNPIFHCEDGDEGLDYLYRRGQYIEPSTSPRPQLILLDLNLPGTDGRELLEEIKKDEKLRKIPVIVLTTSSDERDIEACYQAGANSYIQKPVAFDNFMEAIQRLSDYWLHITILPKSE